MTRTLVQGVDLSTQRRAYVHIGHPKTGSSYIQSLLASNTELLGEHGLTYPSNRATKYSRQGGVTKGNIPPEKIATRRFARQLETLRGDVVVSSEKIFSALAEDPGVIEPILKRFPLVRMLLVLRDPYDYVRSYYTQRVKTGDFNGTLDDYIIANDYCLPHLDRVMKVIRYAQSSGIDLMVRNYSSMKQSLLEVTGEFLNIDPAEFELPPVEVVNRSLTGSELYLQRAFNAHMSHKGGAYRLISYPLVTRLPTIKADRPWASPAVYGQLRERLAPKMEEVNALLPEGVRYAALIEQPQAATIESGFVFSGAQLDVLAESLAKAIPNRRLSKRSGLIRLIRRVLRQ